MDVRRSTAAALVGVLLAACTSAGPAAQQPSPTARSSDVPADGSGGATAEPEPLGAVRAVVVVGPTPAAPPGEVAALVDAAAALPAALEGLEEVRVVRADTLAFAEELARTFVDDGAELVCLVGAGTSARLARLALARPAARLCGTDAPAGPVPANLAVATHDPSLVARAAGAAVGADAERLVVLGRSNGERAQQLRAGVVAGSAPGVGPGGGSAPATPSAGAADEASRADGAGGRGRAQERARAPRVVVRTLPSLRRRAAPVLADLLRPRTDLVLTLTGRVDGFVARSAARRGVPSVGLSDWLRRPGDALPDGVLVAVDVDRAAVLAAAAAAALEGRGGVDVLGAEDEVLAARPGPAAGAAAATARARAVLAPPEG